MRKLLAVLAASAVAFVVTNGANSTD